LNIDDEINKDEKNTDALFYVWTGTKEDGTPADEFERCLDWTTKNNDYKEYVGKKDKTTRDWTFKDDKACNYERRLCCLAFKHVPVTTPPTPPATSTKTSKTELTTTNNDATTTSEVVTTTLESSTAGEATTTSDVATATRDPITTTEEIIPTSTHPPSRP
jgi:hypothetical protein